jgi:membrane associated rhomboid family serine protease
MLLPYTVDVPMQRRPVANWVLIGLTLAGTAYQVAYGVTAPEDNLLQGRSIPASIQLVWRLVAAAPAGPLAVHRNHFSFWQLFTYPFAEPGVGSLLLNMMFLFCFGNAVNARLGHVLYAAMYMLIAVLAALLWLLATKSATLLGSVGAVMGVTGAFVVFYPRNDVRIFYLGRVGLGTFLVASYWMVLISMALDLVAVLIGLDGGLPYACALAGQLAGFVMALGLLVTGRVAPVRHEENLLQVLGLQPKIGEVHEKKLEPWEFKPMTEGALSRGLAGRGKRPGKGPGS